MWSVRVRVSLTTWQLQGSWTSYLVAQGSRYACSREKAENCSTFYDPALEVPSMLSPLLYPVGRSSQGLTQIQGKGNRPRGCMPQFAEQFSFVSFLALWLLLWVSRRGWDSSRHCSCPSFSFTPSTHSLP